MKLLRPGELASVLPRDGLALVSSCSAESDLLADEVEAAQPGPLEFVGIFVPGLNRRTWSGRQARVTTFFQTPQLAREGDRARFLPLCYADILAFMRRSKPTAAVFMCAPPDDSGYCSFGTEVAHIAALWEEIPVRIAHINPLMPRTPGEPGIPVNEITAAFDAPQPLRTMTVGEPDESALAIARHVASQVPNGATLQTGLGKVPDAVLHALTGHRELRIHTGLVGDGALALVRSGAMAPGASALAGVAIGSAELYAGLNHEHFQFRPVTVTHDPETLSQIDKLVTINSAMEVDLFGQVFAEASSRGFQSGPGGASDFARAARLSPGGLRIIALPSRAVDASRIVAPGDSHGPVSLSRFEVDLVVTEHGIADLRFKDHGERARSLVAIAAPEHRERLSRAWSEIERRI